MKLIEIARKKFNLASRLARTAALFVDCLCLSIAQILLFILSPWGLVLPSILLWTAGLFFIDGFVNGRGLGKRLLSLQVIRLKDGKPCNLKDSFVRRFTGFFQPFDLLFSLGGKKQRMGDKLAETVVVQYDPYPEEVMPEKEDPEKVLESAIIEITNRLSEARQKG